jgi:chromosome segregation protein
MHIKEIEIDNFKSFADKTTIPFLPGFTTVSGPNGSGKSNIIDSILFALGLSTSRTLRAERISQFINNTGRRNEASVKITLAVNSNSGFSVTRKIRKGAGGFSSLYYLNDKNVTLTEIHEELAKHNITPTCYNVIMQGDVISIINVTPFERRKILDEIAGVADFDRRIEQAKKELETVESRVDKSSIILNEIDIRLSQLEEERAHALKYQKLKEEKQSFENQITTVKYFDIKNSTERLHESILEATKNKKEEEEKLNEINGKLEVTQERYKEISELVKSKGEDEQIALRQQIELLKGVISRKNDALNFIYKQIADNRANAAVSHENIEKLKEKNEDFVLKIENTQDEVSIIEHNIKSEKSDLLMALDESTSINKFANEHIEKRSLLRKELENKQDEENGLLKEKMVLEEKISRFQKDIETAEKEIQKSESLKSEFLSKKDILETQTGELSQEIKDYEIAQKSCMTDLDKAKNELNDLNYNITLAYRRVTQLEAGKKAAEEVNLGRATETIMNSGLTGIHAPLAKLGQVDKKYATALEIAMGGRMKYIVVDNDEVASVAIEILKSSQSGRATFLPLNKIAQMPHNLRLPNVEGVVDFAVNLISYENTYESAFWHALGDTLVVEDMNSARRLIGKYRMVTLDGSLVEKTGAMTGGSVSKSGIKFGQAEDEELSVYKTRLGELEKDAEKAERAKLDAEKRLDKIRMDYSSTMSDFNIKKIELENLLRNLNDAETSISENRLILEQASPELNTSQTALAVINEKLSKISGSIKNIALEIETVEKSLPKDDLAKINELTESIEFEIKSNESKLANLQNEIKSMILEINFNEETSVVQEERIEKFEKDNLTLEEEKVSHKRDIEVTERNLVELNEKIKELGGKLVELQSERDIINTEVHNLEKKKNICETKLERFIEQSEAFKTRRKELETELFSVREELTTQGINIASLAKPDISTEELNKNIARLQRRMNELEPVNMRALLEYDEVQARREELNTRIDTLSSEKNQIIERMNGYEDLKHKSFMVAFNNVNNNFKDIFNQLSEGLGSLILENPQSPFSGGLTIEAQPRDKKMQRLEGMSGGEKSLTALAFVFAIQRYMPAPFYAFDEVDMHLDGINAEKLASLIKNQSANTQFVVVSLRKPMIESADRTIGVTQKNNGITKVTGVTLRE